MKHLNESKKLGVALERRNLRLNPRVDGMAGRILTFTYTGWRNGSAIKIQIYSSILSVMTADSIIAELKKKGDPQIKAILMRHGAKEPIFGVRISDMQPIRKKIKKDHSLSLQLFKSKIYDAMYLAGLIADEKKMSKDEIEQWAISSHCHGISEYTVAWVAGESRFGWELGIKWIESDKELVVCTGWSTLAGWVALQPDEGLDLKKIRSLVKRIEKDIHHSSNHVRYVMNSFIISVGTYVKELTEECIQAANRIGKVTAEFEGICCTVPEAAAYINKAKAKGVLGKKRKMLRC